MMKQRHAWLAVFLSAFILQHSEFDVGSLAWVTGSLGEAVAVRGSRASIHVRWSSLRAARQRRNAGVVGGVDHTVNQSGKSRLNHRGHRGHRERRKTISDFKFQISENGFLSL